MVQSWITEVAPFVKSLTSSLVTVGQEGFYGADNCHANKYVLLYDFETACIMQPQPADPARMFITLPRLLWLFISESLIF